jgi:hypothetical protein
MPRAVSKAPSLGCLTEYLQVPNYCIHGAPIANELLIRELAGVFDDPVNRLANVIDTCPESRDQYRLAIDDRL